MNRRQLLVSSVIVMLGLDAHAISAEEHNDPALIKSMGSAKVTLQQGLAAAAQQGQPISGKFELEDGKLQLSVYSYATAMNGLADQEDLRLRFDVLTKTKELASALGGSRGAVSENGRLRQKAGGHAGAAAAAC